MHIAAPWPPAPLLDRIATTTDADGRAVLDGFRPEDVFRVDVAIEGFVTQGHSFTPPGPEEKTVSLRPVGRLSARFVADDPNAVRGWTLTACTTPDEPGYRGCVDQLVRETSDEAGRVDLPAARRGADQLEGRAARGVALPRRDAAGRGRSGRAS